jgi:hypothetical protein
MYDRKRCQFALCRLIGSFPRLVKSLDVGGSPFFRESVEIAGKRDIAIRTEEGANDGGTPHVKQPRLQNFRMILGDACDMRKVPTKTCDLAICGSVIEHVGSWAAMTTAAQEVFRVEKHGWLRFLAFEFHLSRI